MTLYKYQEKYDKTHTTKITLKLNLTTDKDILDKLESVGKGHKQGYIKELIRADLKGEEEK